VFKGEILEHDPMASERRATEGDHSHGGGDRERGRRRENA
jgi:small subunit ribosomal protein S3